MVAQVTSSKTSLSGYITRQDSRSSPSSAKCSNSTANRALGSSSSNIVMLIGAIVALHAESRPKRIMPSRQQQIRVNLTSEPWRRELTSLRQVLKSPRRRLCPEAKPLTPYCPAFENKGFELSP